MKKFSELKHSFLSEASKVKPLLGKTKEELEKLPYSKFPEESDPELRELSYKERSVIMYAKDAVMAASRDKIKKDILKVGRAEFKKSGAKVGDYTTLGLVTKVTRTGVIFNSEAETSFGGMLAGGNSVFKDIKKISKAKYVKQVKQQRDSYTASMIDYTNKSPKRLD